MTYLVLLRSTAVFRFLLVEAKAVEAEAIGVEAETIGVEAVEKSPLPHP